MTTALRYSARLFLFMYASLELKNEVMLPPISTELSTFPPSSLEMHFHKTASNALYFSCILFCVYLAIQQQPVGEVCKCNILMPPDLSSLSDKNTNECCIFQSLLIL